MSKILITGVNHGLGLALCKQFLAEGHEVFAGVFPGRSAIQVEELKNNKQLHLINLDISSDDSVKKVYEIVFGLTSELDIIVNNAGMIPKDEIHGPQKNIFEKLDFESIKEAINVNALGTLRVCNSFISLLENGATKVLVNISSEAGSINNSFREEWFGYCMSKAALNMAGTIIHNAFYKKGGQVLQIHPGYLQTYMGGEKNENATYPAEFGAQKIYEVIMNAEQYKGLKASFVDLFGNKMDW